MNTSFIHNDYATRHPGITRMQGVYRAARALGHGFTGTRSLTALLLGAAVAALMVVADHAIDTWADDHLLAAWVALWAVAFFALGLFSGVARRLAGSSLSALNAWSARVARARADARLWAVAERDPRIMAEITRAMADAVPEATPAPQPEYSADVARSFNIDDDIEASHIRRGRILASRYYL